MMARVAPSLLSADFSRVGEWLPLIEEEEVTALHWDFMDGKYVSQNGVDQSQLSILGERTEIPFDVHLMVQEPENMFEKLSEEGVKWASFHLEASKKPTAAVKAAIDCGLRLGLAVNNQRKVEDVLQFFNKIDFVLVMTVEAGLGGQEFIEENLEKVRFLRNRIDTEGLDIDIEIDGGINAETGRKAVEAGADILVAGNYIFKSDDIKRAIADLKAIEA